MRASILATIFGIFLLLAVRPARADAIDGAWCHAGNRLMISGATIVTAAGSQTRGDYSRHAFSYVAPAGDPDFGTAISMLLLDEDTVQLRAGAQAPAEIWLRCGPPVS